MNPDEQSRIVGRVGCPGGEDARGLAELPLHPVVNRIDPRRDCQGLSLGAETEIQHRVEGAVKASRPTPALGAERTVVGDALSHQRVSELEQDSRALGQQQDDLFLKLPGYGTDVGKHIRRVRSRDPTTVTL